MSTKSYTLCRGDARLWFPTNQVLVAGPSRHEAGVEHPQAQLPCAGQRQVSEGGELLTLGRRKRRGIVSGCLPLLCWVSSSSRFCLKEVHRVRETAILSHVLILRVCVCRLASAGGGGGVPSLCEGGDGVRDGTVFFCVFNQPCSPCYPSSKQSSRVDSKCCNQQEIVNTMILRPSLVTL